MSGIIISAPLPKTSVVISTTTKDLATAFASKVDAACVITDDASFAAANALYSEIFEFEKALEANRKEVKAPYWDVCTSIDEGCKKINGILAPGRAKLGAAVKAHELQENAKREALRRRAEEEARRIEAERIAAEKQRMAEEAEFNAPPGVAPAPVEEFTAPISKPVQPMWTPPPLKGAVRAKAEMDLVIDDLSLIPREIGGVALLIPDEKAIKQLLKAKVAIPGVRLVERMSTAAKG